MNVSYITWFYIHKSKIFFETQTDVLSAIALFSIFMKLQVSIVDWNKFLQQQLPIILDFYSHLAKRFSDLKRGPASNKMVHKKDTIFWDRFLYPFTWCALRFVASVSFKK